MPGRPRGSPRGSGERRAQEAEVEAKGRPDGPQAKAGSVCRVSPKASLRVGGQGCRLRQQVQARTTPLGAGPSHGPAVVSDLPVQPQGRPCSADQAGPQGVPLSCPADQLPRSGVALTPTPSSRRGFNAATLSPVPTLTSPLIRHRVSGSARTELNVAFPSSETPCLSPLPSPPLGRAHCTWRDLGVTWDPSSSRGPAWRRAKRCRATGDVAEECPGGLSVTVLIYGAAEGRPGPRLQTSGGRGELRPGRSEQAAAFHWARGGGSASAAAPTAQPPHPPP